MKKTKMFMLGIGLSMTVLGGSQVSAETINRQITFTENLPSYSSGVFESLNPEVISLTNNNRFVAHKYGQTFIDAVTDGKYSRSIAEVDDYGRSRDGEAFDITDNSMVEGEFYHGHDQDDFTFTAQQTGTYVLFFTTRDKNLKNYNASLYSEDGETSESLSLIVPFEDDYTTNEGYIEVDLLAGMNYTLNLSSDLYSSGRYSFDISLKENSYYSASYYEMVLEIGQSTYIEEGNWTSENPDVISIDGNRAIAKKYGKTFVTATTNGKYMRKIVSVDDYGRARDGNEFEITDNSSIAGEFYYGHEMDDFSFTATRTGAYTISFESRDRNIKVCNIYVANIEGEILGDQLIWGYDNSSGYIEEKIEVELIEGQKYFLNSSSDLYTSGKYLIEITPNN
ncbi:hypothetical protein [Enterococcus sp. LJL51]|uniref:hypothetical protein n=1 Tax=Enterococcus sp. LJL51 TaxID=3416656 RepID=UPI003CF248EA